MARLLKKGLDYFPMNVDFYEDDKVQLIEAEFGIKGSYIAMRLLCKIYKEDYFYKWGNDQCLLFAKSIGNGIVPNLVKEVVNGLVKRGFFNEQMFNSFGILTSNGIQMRYFDATERYKKVIVIKEYLLIDVTKIINVHINSINVDINSINDDICTHNESESESEIIMREKRKKIPTPENPIYFIPISEIESFMCSDSQWLEVMCMQNHLTEITLKQKIKEFTEKLRAENVKEKHKKDCFQHFSNWVKYPKQSEKTKSNITKLTGQEVYEKF